MSDQFVSNDWTGMWAGLQLQQLLLKPLIKVFSAALPNRIFRD